MTLQQRIEALNPDARGFSTFLRQLPAPASAYCPSCCAEADSLSRNTDVDAKSWKVPLRFVMATTSSAVLALSCTSLLCLMEVFMQRLIAEAGNDSALSTIASQGRAIGLGVTVAFTMLGFLLGWLVAGYITMPMSLLAAIACPSFKAPGSSRTSSSGSNSDMAIPESSLITMQASRIHEVSHLAASVSSMLHNVAVFSKYLPDTIVKSILRGEQRALRQHVSRREVTVMFSDISNFTSIAESLDPKNLVLLLTRYLTYMTKVVESFEGVVSEILGDGLLAFFNTPDDVADHAVKACAAALAQQQALGDLNQELSSLKLPQISLRIGLSTGSVLTGTIGSDTKMKFGCIGDVVNLTSRLEGLCKHYGVSIICSGQTKARVPIAAGIALRELDLVQVKGKEQPTRVIEVVGFRPDAAYNSGSLKLPNSTYLSPGQLEQALLYEEALRAFQRADFAQSKLLLEALRRENTEDRPTELLLERVLKYTSSDDDEGGINLSSVELQDWTGVMIMKEK